MNMATYTKSVKIVEFLMMGSIFEIITNNCFT